MLYSEKVAFNRPQDACSRERGSRFLPFSDNSSTTTRRNPSQPLLEKGTKKDLSEANPGAAMLPASQRQRTLRWHMLHIPHIFTRHCKAFIWVWVSGASERGRFVGSQGKTVVLSMCHRVLCILRVPERRVKERRVGIEASSGGASQPCSTCACEKLIWPSHHSTVLGRWSFVTGHLFDR